MQVRVGLDPVHELPMNFRGTFITTGQSDEQARVDDDAQGQWISRSAGIIPDRPDHLDGVHGGKTFTEGSQTLQSTKSPLLALL